MLASLLPGLRDVRVPLTAGFMWLVVLWTVFYELIPAQNEATGVAAEIYQVLGAFGPAALTAAITFVAYVLGILIAPLTEYLVRGSAEAVVRAVTGRYGLLSRSTRVQAIALAEKTLDAVRDSRGPSRTRKSSGDAAKDSDIQSTSDEGSYDLRHLAKPRSEILEWEMFDDVPLVATRLLAHNRELFDRYDRARAEAAFRFVLVLPLLVMSVLIPLRFGAPWWGYLVSILAGIVVAVFLIVDGLNKQVESNDAIYQAVFVGEAQFPSIEAELARIGHAAGVSKEKMKRSKSGSEPHIRDRSEIR